MPSPVQEMFGRIASRYDRLNRVLSVGTDLRWRRRAVDLLASGHGTVLDLACGTGDLARCALGRGRARQVVGCDFCLPMLRQVPDSRDRIAVCAGDAQRLPFADRSFDAALVAFGWRNFPDPGGALAELHRVLRPGGELLILEFFRPTGLWSRIFHATFARFAIPAIGGLLAGDRAAYRYLRDSISGFRSVDEARLLLAQRGFGALRWISCAGGVAHAVVARCEGGATNPLVRQA